MVAVFAKVEQYPKGAYFSDITHKGGYALIKDLCNGGYLDRIAHGKYLLTQKAKDALEEARKALGVVA